MKNKLTITATIGGLLYLLLILLSSSVPAQQNKRVSEESYRLARQVLEAGIQALGDEQNFQKIEDITLKFRGNTKEMGQSANPNSPYYERQVEGIKIVDFKGKRSYQESKSSFLGGIPTRLGQVLKNNEGFAFDFDTNVFYPIAPPAVAVSARAVGRWLPHTFLKTVMNRVALVRSLGDASFDGRLNHVINFFDAGGAQFALYFDARTKLLTKFESLGDDPLYGSAVSETIFSDYRDVQGVKIPFKTITKYHGEILSVENNIEVVANTRPADSLFEIPAKAEKGQEILGAPAPTVTKLADDVYFVNGISAGSVWFYSQMFVVFSDYILVVESPLNDGISQAVIKKIKETVPNKPIKYLVPTHYHFDHLGGIRGYIAEGIIVLTTPGNQSFIEKVAVTMHPLRPDTLALNPRPLQIETFKGKKVISDGRQTIELYNLGKDPHVDEMVVVYLPREKILFLTDLMMTRVGGPFPPPGPTTYYFAKKIKELNLPIERIANGHGWTGTMNDFLKSL